MNIRILTRRRLAGRHVRPALEWVIVCPICELDVSGYTDQDEASYLVGIHNDLHHGSRPDAYLAPVTEPVKPFGGVA